MASTLSYPLDLEPQIGDGSAVSVAPGVWWLRMPLFAALPWINVWVLADEGGWSIVDTGMQSGLTIDAWQAAFQNSMGGLPVLRVLATHMHPDHCGVAGWLAQRFDVRLWMTRQEYLTGRLLAAEKGEHASADGIRFYRAAGWDDGALEQYQATFGSFGKMIFPLPTSYRRITDGETLTIGGKEWIVIVGSGHSPEHACLYCPELKLLISGDQVLPRISSNVSVYPLEPDADPLSDWLASLAMLKTRIPDDVLVLPAHNSPFVGLHARLAALMESHRRGLARLEDLLETPRRAIDVFGALFARPINASNLGMATGEAFAHLTHLVRTGRATRELDERGVWLWRKATR
jgi:glyoxylase-like metal-dependent hydrolase (beta-lactamase superfamily II)